MVDGMCTLPVYMTKEQRRELRSFASALHIKLSPLIMDALYMIVERYKRGQPWYPNRSGVFEIPRYDSDDSASYDSFEDTPYGRKRVRLLVKDTDGSDVHS